MDSKYHSNEKFILKLVKKRFVVAFYHVHVGGGVRIVSFTEARNGLKSVLHQVVNDADCTVITRPDSEDTVVMSLNYYNSLMETVYLLKSPANAEHLTQISH